MPLEKFQSLQTHAPTTLMIIHTRNAQIDVSTAMAYKTIVSNIPGLSQVTEDVEVDGFGLFDSSGQESLECSAPDAPVLKEPT